MRKYIPSYPAVALSNENGKLAYLGPYSSGIYCRKDQGLIAPFIRNVLTSPPIAALPFDAQGCYCKS
jgi:hypothetical protein